MLRSSAESPPWIRDAPQDVEPADCGQQRDALPLARLDNRNPKGQTSDGQERDSGKEQKERSDRALICISRVSSTLSLVPIDTGASRAHFILFGPLGTIGIARQFCGTMKKMQEARKADVLAICTMIHTLAWLPLLALPAAVLGDDPVALALVRRDHSNFAELTRGIDPGHGKLRGSRGSDIQHMGGLRIVEIADTIAGVDGGQLLPFPASVQNLGPGAAGHEEIASVLINLQTMRPIRPTVGLPLRHRLTRLQVDRRGDVLGRKPPTPDRMRPEPR